MQITLNTLKYADVALFIRVCVRACRSEMCAYECVRTLQPFWAISRGRAFPLSSYLPNNQSVIRNRNAVNITGCQNIGCLVQIGARSPAEEIATQLLNSHANGISQTNVFLCCKEKSRAISGNGLRRGTWMLIQAEEAPHLPFPKMQRIGPRTNLKKIGVWDLAKGKPRVVWFSFIHISVIRIK